MQIKFLENFGAGVNVFGDNQLEGPRRRKVGHDSIQLMAYFLDIRTKDMKELSILDQQATIQLANPN